MFDRSLGWIALAAESTYGTLGTSLVYQQGISVQPTFNRTRVVPPVLGSVTPHVGRTMNSSWSGTVTLGHTDEGDDIGLLYGHFGSVSTGDYTFGGTPVTDSLSLFYDLNGVEYDVAGGVASGLTWTLNNQDYSRVAVQMAGRAVTKYSGATRSPSLPPASELVTPGDLSTFTVGGTAVAGITGGSITYTRNVTGMDRQRLGATTMPQPELHGRAVIEATFNLELDDTTGNDTVALIDSLLADSSAGTIIANNFELSGCHPIGDLPVLERGMGPVSYKVQATGLVVSTS